MFQALSGRGHDVGIFAEAWDECGVPITSYRRVLRFLDSPAAVLIYHHSVGWEPGFALVHTLKCRRVLRYHNVTPPEFFKGISARQDLLCTRGREALGMIARSGCDLYLCCSEYNQQELLDQGADRSRCLVLPPFHQVDRLSLAEPDPVVLSSYQDGKTNILMVGRLAPNKMQNVLIEAFALYRERYDSNSRLFLIGKADPLMTPYVEELHRQAEQLGVGEAIVFANHVSTSALKAYYLAASALVVPSAHEGFCVPLVEAMALGVPIVAYGSTAIPATVSEAGLVWRELDPRLLAESIHYLRQNERARQTFIKLGQGRYRRCFATERLDQGLSAALQDFCKACSPPPEARRWQNAAAAAPQTYSDWFIPVSCPVGTIHVRQDKNLRELDTGIVNEVMAGDTYRIKSLPGSAIHSIVDIGAHIGSFCVFMHHFYPQARVVAYECCPENLPLLKRNVPFGTVIQAAVTYERNVALLNSVKMNGSNSGASTVQPANLIREGKYDKTVYWGDARALALKTLEDVLVDNQLDEIDLLKLDCEGSEFSILENSTSLNRVRLIVGEWHGRDQFMDLVARKFADWKLTVWQDGELGIFWLNRPLGTCG